MEMVMAADKLYEVLGRYVERPDFRISELRIGPAQEVPWHFHTNVRDSFLVLEGNIRITMQGPDEEVLLAQSDIFQVQPGRPHRVTNAGQEPAVFMLLHFKAIKEAVAPVD
jgi:quercetin dioxygenase-like cupin family protein